MFEFKTQNHTLKCMVWNEIKGSILISVEQVDITRNPPKIENTIAYSPK
jgi:hypothetical protein